MQYSPKLKKAMEEIKAIVKKHDIGAFVVLHAPGFSEYHLRIDPSYSCAKYDVATSQLRIKAKLQEDFKGDKEAWIKKVTETVNMLQCFQDTAGMNFLQFGEVLKMLEKFIEIENGGGSHSSHTEQNN